uniref:WHEP-TRS domain-containing protein n=1 Tax=Gopherus agassizii TaxID=38772 RepID=A0A452HUL9_9SAUR
MADIQNGDSCSSSPLELFERVTAQGEKVRSLKAGKASTVILFHLLNFFHFVA